METIKDISDFNNNDLLHEVLDWQKPVKLINKNGEKRYLNMWLNMNMEMIKTSYHGVQFVQASDEDLNHDKNYIPCCKTFRIEFTDLYIKNKILLSHPYNTLIDVRYLLFTKPFPIDATPLLINLLEMYHIPIKTNRVVITTKWIMDSVYNPFCAKYIPYINDHVNDWINMLLTYVITKKEDINNVYSYINNHPWVIKELKYHVVHEMLKRGCIIGNRLFNTLLDEGYIHKCKPSYRFGDLSIHNQHKMLYALPDLDYGFNTDHIETYNRWGELIYPYVSKHVSPPEAIPVSIYYKRYAFRLCNSPEYHNYYSDSIMKHAQNIGLTFDIKSSYIPYMHHTNVFNTIGVRNNLSLDTNMKIIPDNTYIMMCKSGLNISIKELLEMYPCQIVLNMYKANHPETMVCACEYPEEVDLGPASFKNIKFKRLPAINKEDVKKLLIDRENDISDLRDLTHDTILGPDHQEMLEFLI